MEILRCFFTAQAQQKYVRYLEPVLAAAGESYLVADHVAPLLSSTKHPQGVFCQCRWPQGLLVGGPVGEASCAVLEDLQDPGNLGTILRTAEALGSHPGVTCWESAADPLSPKALRASMGAAFRLGLWVEPSREKLCSQLEAQGFLLLASVPDSAALPVTQVDFSQGKYAVFIGTRAMACVRKPLPGAGG